MDDANRDINLHFKLLAMAQEHRDQHSRRFWRTVNSVLAAVGIYGVFGFSLWLAFLPSPLNLLGWIPAGIAVSIILRYLCDQAQKTSERLERIEAALKELQKAREDRD